jgi:hypothetical protein
MSIKRKPTLIILSIFMVLNLTTMIAAPAFGEVGKNGHPLLDSINEQLELEGVNYRVDYAEYITTTDGPEFGRMIIVSNRGNKQMPSHFVPYDPRRWSSSDIYWLIDFVDGATSSGLSPAETAAAIRRAMTTWDSVPCATIPLIEVPDYGIDWGYVQWLLGFGGIAGWYADYTHGGFLPGPFFDLIEPNGSTYILGITFTFIFIDPQTGEPTDIDANRKSDTAFRETYYNVSFIWDIDTDFDVETVALHEAGHGLSQAHFGDIFQDAGKRGKVHVAPRAVMNAVYFGIQQELEGTDESGHCSIWAYWLNR